MKRSELYQDYLLGSMNTILNLPLSHLKALSINLEIFLLQLGPYSSALAQLLLMKPELRIMKT